MGVAVGGTGVGVGVAVGIAVGVGVGVSVATSGGGSLVPKKPVTPIMATTTATSPAKASTQIVGQGQP